MARLNMSPMWLKNVPVPGKGQQDWTDTGYRGGGSLSLRVSYGGSKTWFFMYRHEGRLRRFKLGSYPTVKLGRACDCRRPELCQRYDGQKPET